MTRLVPTPTRARAVLAAALAALTTLAACVTQEADVLSSGPTLLACPDVVASHRAGQPCDFTGVCTIPLPPTDPNGVACCSDLAVCSDHALVVDRYCPPTCQACMDDSTCSFGASYCAGDRCVACVDPATCPPCPIGTAPLSRNGCATCTCAPPAECGPNRGPNGGCDPSRTCYPGLVCADGCGPGDLACCANACADAGCPIPAPLGCAMACPPNTGCGQCMATACACAMGQWVCTPVCSPVVGPCFLPG